MKEKVRFLGKFGEVEVVENNGVRTPVPHTFKLSAKINKNDNVVIDNYINYVILKTQDAFDMDDYKKLFSQSK